MSGVAGAPPATEHRPTTPALPGPNPTHQVHQLPWDPPNLGQEPQPLGWVGSTREPTQLPDQSQGPGRLQSFVGGPGHPATTDNFLSMGK